jgi:signal-transduction protein with cAMP-binding, CBS, and nucleotidyltransferase domain
MNIGEICTRRVVIAQRGTSIRDVAGLMREQHTGDIVVTEEAGGRQVPIGILTDRDLVIEILAEGLNPAELTAGEVMTENPVTAREGDGIFETVQLMRSAGVRRAPIVEASGALVGIVSLDDILEVMAEELGNLMNLLRQERRKEVETRH